jgi:hypothetical protein
MRRWNRKCGGYGQMDNWDGSKSNNTVIGCSFNGTTQLQARIQVMLNGSNNSWMPVGMDISLR